MKKLIIKPNCIKQKDENVEKIIEQWTSGSNVVVVPPGYDVEVVDDGRNEITKFLDHEIEKRKAAVEEEEYYKETCESLQKTIVKLNEIVQEQGLKLKEYEKAAVSKQISPTDEIIVGDEVRHFNSLGVVVKANEYHVCVLTIDRNYITVDKKNLEKTSRNFPQIEEVLEQIRNEDRQSKD